MSYKKLYSPEKILSEENSSGTADGFHESIIISEGITKTPNGEKLKDKKTAFLGFFYAFLSASLFVLSSVIVKKLSYITTGQLTFLRNASIFVGSLPIAIACRESITRRNKEGILLVARSILGTIASYLNIIAFALLPLADAAILLSIVPVLTILFARVLLRESCSVIQSICLVVTLCGILLSARLPELLNERSDHKFDQNYILGFAASVGCVITLSLTYVILRKMKNIHFSVTMLYFGIFGMIENAIINGIMQTYSPVNCGWDNFLYIAITFLAFAGNLTWTLAFRVEGAGVMSIVRASSEIIIAIIYQIIFFNEFPDAYNIGGGILVITSLSMLGVRNWLLTLPKESKIRKKLKYLLM